MKGILITICLLIIAGLTVLVIKITNAKHIKLANFELESGDSTKQSKATIIDIQKMQKPITVEKETLKAQLPVKKAKFKSAPAFSRRVNQKRVDSPKLSKILPLVNPINVNGNNNHIVGGTGNNVGVNGDVNINDDARLSDEAMNWLFNWIDNKIKNQGFKIGNLSISTEPYSNAPNLPSQIISYFKKRGYTIDSFGLVFSGGPMIEGVYIDTGKMPKINIIIGHFK